MSLRQLSFSAPSPHLRLADGDVDLWRIDLEVEADASVLDAAERERAMRFRHARDRLRYIAAHVSMRTILARYLAIAPERLRFAADGVGGKLKLATARAPAFNLAHSGDLALLGVAAVAFLGIDIEALRPMADLRELARTHFTRHEYRQVMREGAVVPESFFTVWTRKEAVVKATGTGLVGDLRGIEVGAAHGPLCVHLGDEVVEVESFVVAPGFAAALALPWSRTLGARRYFDSGLRVG